MITETDRAANTVKNKIVMMEQMIQTAKEEIQEAKHEMAQTTLDTTWDIWNKQHLIRLGKLQGLELGFSVLKQI